MGGPAEPFPLFSPLAAPTSEHDRRFPTTPEARILKTEALQLIRSLLLERRSVRRSWRPLRRRGQSRTEGEVDDEASRDGDQEHHDRRLGT